MPIHSKPNRGESVEWMTPPDLLAALGEFDLDPCANSASVIRTAARYYALPQDGLALPWSGRVWLNPPYGRHVIDRWLARMVEHNCGTALVPARTEVEEWFWPYIWQRATALLFLRGRLYFRHLDGTEDGNAGHGSVLVAYGAADAEKLETSTLSGQFVRLENTKCLGSKPARKVRAKRTPAVPAE